MKQALETPLLISEHIRCTSLRRVTESKSFRVVSYVSINFRVSVEMFPIDQRKSVLCDQSRRTGLSKMQHADCLPDDDTDLNELTDEMHDQRMVDALDRFWEQQSMEMNLLEIGTEQDFKNHNDLPLARIKRIMKSDEDVRMISAEAPVLFAKACEMFILELSLRANAAAEKSKRRTLQKEDVEAAIKQCLVFDFLVDLP